MKPLLHLGVREREIMETVYRLGEASVEEVRQELTGRPHYSTVRTMLNKLEDKGHLRHRSDGTRFLYRPVLPRPEAQRRTMRQILQGVFDGSTERAMTALLEAAEDLSPEELDRILRAIERYRSENR